MNTAAAEDPKEPSICSRFLKLCEYSLMAEVSATPKPGLVDLHDSGAHKDMDHDTFRASSAAIAPHITRLFRLVTEWSGTDGAGLFNAIRPVGIEAEKAMFEATGGVNTHKGMIFSMGVIGAAAGLFYRDHGCFRPEDILTLAGDLCADTLARDFERIDPSAPRTHGALLYVRYGIKGIRGEAQKGFPSIRDISLPAIRLSKKTCADDNQVYLNTLLALMSQVDDTNVLIRTNHALLNYEKAEASRILALGGASSQKGMDALRRLNEDFIRLNISPGGCADLLAVTILLWQLEQIQGGYYETEVRGTRG